VPKSGRYTIQCESDDGCSVNINDADILSDNIHSESANDLLQLKFDIMEKYVADGHWLDFVRPKFAPQPDRFERHNKSIELSLNANEW